MGASGLLETALMVEACKNNKVPCIVNRTTHDERFLSQPTDFPDGLCLSLAAGMGNVYSAALFDMRV
jgi:hypothetical protein